MASDALKMGRGSQATVRKCIEMINRKIIAAMQYAVRFSVFDSNSTLRELTTAQSLLLSLLHGSLRQDIQFCLYIINMSSNVVQLWSSHIKVWLKDDFIFRKDDIAKAFSNLAVMMDRNSHIQLPQNIAVAFSGLINKYKLFDVFQSSGDRTAMAFVSALNSYILKITKNQEPTLQEVGAASNPSTVECSPPAAASPMVQEVNEACGHSNPTPTPSSSQEVSAASNPALQCSPPPAVSSTVQCSPSPAASPVIQEVNEACGHSNPTPTTSSSQAGRVFDRPNSKPVLALHNQAGHVFARSNSKPVLALHNKDHIYRCLRDAIVANNLEEVQGYLLMPGIDVNWGSEYGDTFLHTAVRCCRRKIVVALLKHGALPEMNNRHSISSLELAIKSGSTLVFQALFACVDDINHMFDNGNTILHEIASTQESSSLMKIVLRYIPDIDIKNKNGYTALHLATKSDNLKAVKDLMEAGADANIGSKYGETCLHIAAANGLYFILEQLLPTANIESKEFTGRTALHLAANHGSYSCVRLLLKNGLNVNAKAPNNRTVLHEAVERNNIDIVRELLKSGAATNSNAEHEHSPLHSAATYGYEEIVIALLDNGARVNARDLYGHTPRRLAKSLSSLKIEKILKARGGVL